MLISVNPKDAFADLILLLVQTLFSLQKQEEEESLEHFGPTPVAPDEVDKNASFEHSQMTLELVSKSFQNELASFPLDFLTVSEILRLFITSGGVFPKSLHKNYAWQWKGGFSNQDNAFYEFKTSNPQVLESLLKNNVYDLSIDEKLSLLLLLTNQILTYVSVRELIEENMDRLRQTKAELRNLTYREQRRIKIESAARCRSKAVDIAEKRSQKAGSSKEQEEESKHDDEPVALNVGKKSLRTTKDEEEEAAANAKYLEELAKTDFKTLSNSERVNFWLEKDLETSKRKEEYLLRESECSEEIEGLTTMTQLTSLGMDRLFRSYWLLKSIPVIFVENTASDITPEALEPVEQRNLPPPAIPNEVFQHLKTSSRNVSSNSLFTLGGQEGRDSPASSSNEFHNAPLPTEDDVTVPYGDKSTQGFLLTEIIPPNRPNWAFIDSVAQLDNLIASLNPRGVRESVLRTNLLQIRDKLAVQLSTEFTDLLTDSEAIATHGSPDKKVASVKSRRRTIQGMVNNKSAHEFMELTVRDMILDLEERIHMGALGVLRVKDRSTWKTALENGAYDPQCDTLTWNIPNASREENMTEYLKKKEGKDEVDAVEDLVRAVLQVEQSIEKRFLLPPLGTSLNPNARNKSAQKNAKSTLEYWENTLMLSTSLSQLALHLSILEKSIIWSKSLLNVSCRICRKRNDADKMLLCDGCDRGHHLYCLKPKLKKIPTGDWFCSGCKPKKLEKRVKPKKDFYKESSEFGYELFDDERTSPASRQSLESEEKKVNARKRASKDSGSTEESSLIKKSRTRKASADLEKCETIILSLLDDSSAKPFTQPVSKLEAPDYYDLIANPMDLGTIIGKFEANKYSCPVDVFYDMMLIFKNCETYNMSSAPVSRECRALKKLFMAEVRSNGLNKYLPSSSSAIDD